LQEFWGEIMDSADEERESVPSLTTKKAKEAVKYMSNQVRKLKTVATPARFGEMQGEEADVSNVHIEMGEMAEMNDVSTVLRDIQDADDDNVKVWGAETDLDQFFADMYHFYRGKGLYSMVASSVVDLLTLGFTVIFSTFLLALVDWEGMVTHCSAADGADTQLERHEECPNFNHFISYDFFAHPTKSLGRFFLLCYLVLFAFIWVWNFLALFPALKTGWHMHRFYRDSLQIGWRELQTMQWSDVVKKFLRLHQRGHSAGLVVRNKVVKSQLSAHTIASRIMRKDNFLIAFFNRGLLRLTIDLPLVGEKTVVSNMLEWSLQVCLIDYMFDEKFQIRPQFLNGVDGLRRRFFFAGIINACMLPFILMYMIARFFMKHAQEWHGKKNSSLGKRSYSLYALWLFREFNELPHVFDKRIFQSYEHAHLYLAQFESQELAIVARGFMYVSGAFVGVLIGLTLVGDGSLLLYVDIYSRPLIWYLTIFSGVFAASRALVPSPEQKPEDPQACMTKCAAQTHYMPRHWRGDHRLQSFDVRDEFTNLFQFKAQLFFDEVINVVCNPWVLCFCLPECAEDIVEFVRDYHELVPGVGAVCVYSQFDFKRFGDPRYGSKVKGGAAAAGKRQFECAVQGKMEKSFINFKENHPEWVHPDAHNEEEAQQLLDSIGSFAIVRHEHRLHESMNSLSQSMHSSQASLHSPSASLVGSASKDKVSPPLSSMQGLQEGGLHTPEGGDSTEGLMQEAKEEEGEELSKIMTQRQTKRAERSVHWPEVSNHCSQYGTNISASAVGSLAISAYTNRAAASAALMQTLTDTAHENNFFWLEQYAAAQLDQEGDGQQSAYNSVAASRGAGESQVSMLVDRLNRAGGDLGSYTQATDDQPVDAAAFVSSSHRDYKQV
jgi:autophagy-related protein 9